VARLIERAHPHPPNQSLLRKNNKDGIKKTARKLRDQAYKDGPFRFSLNTPLGGLRRESEHDPRRTSLLPPSRSYVPESMFSNKKPKSSTYLVDVEARITKTTELATLALDKAGLVHDENEYFKKTDRKSVGRNNLN